MEFDRHTFYIVSAYAMVVLAVLIELWHLRRHRRHARKQAIAIAAVSASRKPASQQPESSMESS